ncbi:MAG: hypothetical protein Q8T09_03785 [Candidatus Melainabacteria bacterium]|nr:hypothetical protein [Candidatus Melainabacteria bacterium]
MSKHTGKSLHPSDESHSADLSPNADESARATLTLEALGDNGKGTKSSDSTAAQISDQADRKRLEQAKDDFALKHQILISQDATGKQLTYTVRSGDSSIDVLTSDNSREALANAEKQIERLTKAKENQLNADFKLRFSQDNEEVGGQVAIAPDGTVSHGKMIYARPPFLSELYGIEAVMERALPSQLTKDGKTGVKFYFLKDSLYQEDRGASATYTHSDKEGKPAIYVAKDGIGATLVKKGESFEWQGGIDTHMILHEFAHNSQLRLGLDEEKKLIQFSNGCGFAPFERPGTNETIWALRSKDGKLYRHDNEVGGWQQIDDQGNLIKSAELATDKTETLDDIEMAKLAEVRPPTYYFDNPVEMAAEGMAMLKEGASSRKQLQTTTPVFYQFIKEQDQKDINLAFGLDTNGKAKLIRRPDGKLTANDEAAQKIILEFEK